MVGVVPRWTSPMKDKRLAILGTTPTTLGTTPTMLGTTPTTLGATPTMLGTTPTPLVLVGPGWQPWGTVSRVSLRGGPRTVRAPPPPQEPAAALSSPRTPTADGPHRWWLPAARGVDLEEPCGKGCGKGRGGEGVPQPYRHCFSPTSSRVTRTFQYTGHLSAQNLRFFLVFGGFCCANDCKSSTDS